jgi:DNA polymerase-3 subunit alpha
MIENVDRELESLGVVLSASPYKHKESLLRGYNLTSISEAKEAKGSLTIGGIIRARKVIKTKSGQPMAFMTVYDDTGDIEVIVFPRSFADVATQLDKNRLVVISGHVETDKTTNFVAEKITIIEEHP